MKLPAPNDDLFSPRPAFTRGEKTIRVGALLAAILIGLGFVSFDLFTLGGGFFDAGPPTTKDIFFVLIVTLFEIPILVCCWRCWLFRRWACVSTVVLLIIVPNIISWVIALFLLDAMRLEWRNLKTGF